MAKPHGTLHHEGAGGSDAKMRADLALSEAEWRLAARAVELKTKTPMLPAVCCTYKYCAVYYPSPEDMQIGSAGRPHYEHTAPSKSKLAADPANRRFLLMIWPASRCKSPIVPRRRCARWCDAAGAQYRASLHSTILHCSSGVGPAQCTTAAGPPGIPIETHRQNAAPETGQCPCFDEPPPSFADGAAIGRLAAIHSDCT